MQNKEKKYLICPGCGRIISELERDLARADFKCVGFRQDLTLCTQHLSDYKPLNKCKKEK